MYTLTYCLNNKHKPICAGQLNVNEINKQLQLPYCTVPCIISLCVIVHCSYAGNILPLDTIHQYLNNNLIFSSFFIHFITVGYAKKAELPNSKRADILQCLPSSFLTNSILYDPIFFYGH